MALRLGGLFAVFCVLGAQFATAQDGPPLPTTPQAWRAAAEQDVRAAYELLAANHPGMVDPENPGFPDELAKARDAGLATAARVQDAEGYRAAINQFSLTLQDGHAGASAQVDAGRPREWPGFVPVWRGERMLVHTSTVGSIPRGAEVRGCDGAPMREVVLRTAFAFDGRPAEAGQWWELARNAFVDFHDPFIARPQQCEFALGEKVWTETLSWREEDDAFVPLRIASYNGKTLPIGLSEPAAGVFWIAMPTFAPDADGVKAYAQLNADLQARRKNIANARAVVLDLRDNQGGSGGWSWEVTVSLWGKKPVETAMEAFFAEVQIVWRPTAGNEAYVRATVPKFEEGGQSDFAKEWRLLADQMAAARGRGEPLLAQGGEEKNRKEPGKLVASKFARPVYVIMPGQCASACLDAVDVFSRFPNTKLIGAPTSGDSKYLEVRREMTPSGFTQVVIPNKMWVNRPRGHGQIYEPAILVEDLDWSTEAFLAVIEADLAR